MTKFSLEILIGPILAKSAKNDSKMVLLHFFKKIYCWILLEISKIENYISSDISEQTAYLVKLFFLSYEPKSSWAYQVSCILRDFYTFFPNMYSCTHSQVLNIIDAVSKNEKESLFNTIFHHLPYSIHAVSFCFLLFLYLIETF